MNLKLKEEYEQLKRIAISLAKEMREKLPISSYELNENCETHAEYYGRVSEMYGKVFVIAHRIEQAQKEAWAGKSLEVRNDPGQYGFDKLTEGTLKDILTADEDLVKWEHLEIDSQGLLVEMKGLLDAYEHRRSMLNNEVQLLLSGFGGVNFDKKKETFQDGLARRKAVRRASETQTA